MPFDQSSWLADGIAIAYSSVVASLRTRNACSATPAVIPFSATVTIDQYTCTKGRLEYWRMKGAGHTWAGSPIPLDIVTGPTDHSFSATNVVLERLSIHRRSDLDQPPNRRTVR